MTRLSSIINARLIDTVGEHGGSLSISGDRIIESAFSEDAFDAKGAFVAPGIVDLGVFAVDKAAFIAGGITRVALMPDQSPVLDDPGPVQRAALAAKPDLWVHPL
ncbi:MAG: dihydroorotase, partial [Pseudomonadota bacterium]